MFQIDNSTAVSKAPAPSAAGTPGFFTDGDLQSGVAPTIVPAEFLNALMMEMLGVLAGAGIQPSKTANNQILLAIRTMIRQSIDYYQDAGTVANAYVVPALNPNPELVTNGAFNSDLSGWTTQVSGTSTVSWFNGYAQIVGDGTHSANLIQGIATVPGKVYQVVFDVLTNPVIAVVGSAAATSDMYNPTTATTPVGANNRFTFTATAATSYLTFVRAAVTTGVDNVSVRDTGELVINGQFTTDASGWSSSASWGSTASAVAGEMQVSVTVANGRQIQPITCVAGQTYRLSGSMRAISGSAASIGISKYSDGGLIASVAKLSNSSSVATNLSQTFTATATTMYVVLGDDTGTAGGLLGFDNVSVKLSPANPIPFKFRTTRANTGPVTIDIGQGIYPLRTEQGAELAAGDIAANSVTSCVFDPALGYAVVTETVASQLGTLAKENIGQGLEDDGAGNLRVKLADSSLRRTASGVQVAAPVVAINANTALANSHQGSALRVTGAYTITAPATSTLWNGYAVSVIAQGGNVTFAINAADKMNGGAAGAGLSLLQGQTVDLVTDGAGNWWPLFQATPAGSYSPRYITSSQLLAAGTYEVDTTAGPVTITLPTGVPVGTILEFFDPFGTWGNNPLTLARNGNTIIGVADDLVWDLSGESFRAIYNGSDWRIY